MSRGLGERQRNMLRLVCGGCMVYPEGVPSIVAATWELEDTLVTRGALYYAKNRLDQVNEMIEMVGDSDVYLQDAWYKARNEFHQMLGVWLADRRYNVNTAKDRSLPEGADLDNCRAARKVVEANYRAIRTLQDRGLVEVLVGTQIVHWRDGDYPMTTVLRDWVFPTEAGIEEARRLGLH